MIVNNTNGEHIVEELGAKYGYKATTDLYHGKVRVMTDIDKTNRIEQVIKALGTMVLFPTEISDPNNIGQKIYGQPVQRPILEGANRDKVLNKLVELIVED